MRLMLDTDHCVAILRGLLNVDEHIEPTTPLMISAITVSELVYSALKSNRPEYNLRQVEKLMNGVSVLPFSTPEAKRCGTIKDQLRRNGQLIGEPDIQIASIALEHALPLATNNQKHFQRISDLKLLDWLEK